MDIRVRPKGPSAGLADVFQCRCQAKVGTRKVQFGILALEQKTNAAIETAPNGTLPGKGGVIPTPELELELDFRPFFTPVQTPTHLIGTAGTSSKSGIGLFMDLALSILKMKPNFTMLFKLISQNNRA